MKTVFILEDNSALRNELIILLAKYPQWRIVGFSASIIEGRQLILQLNPDLVLMDIELTDGSSFELIKQIEHITFKIIFITAYNQFAINAIRCGAVDYLLKPVIEKEFKDALDKAYGELNREMPNFQKEILINGSNGERLVIRTQNEIFFIKIPSIVCCQAEGSYTNFILNDGRRIMSSSSLKEYEELLPPHKFLRTHKSYIVNVDFVLSYETDGTLILENGLHALVSQRRKDTVLHFLYSK